MKEKHRKHSNRLAKCILALILAVIFPIQSLPGNAFAAYAKEEQEIAMTEGEIRSGFIGEGQTAESEDPSVAWVDSDGNLCAMRAGVTVISTDPDSEEEETVLHDITVNGESIFSDDDYDAEKDAYSFIMPAGKCWLKISCETARVKAKNNKQLQVVVGETLNVDDNAELVKDHADGYSSLQWYLDESDAGITSGIRYGDESHKTLVAEKTGKYTVTARTRENEYVEKAF
ncbi:MAG: hypothetical protein K5897_11215 [Eubacterium sp.]|nr:hypothetical protein [Eubacterium sp.]